MGLSDDVAQFTKGCEHLLAALAGRTEFSETEKEMVSYYLREITSKIKSLRGEQETEQE